MAREVEDDHETRGMNTSMGYLQRTIQATVTIWLSLTVVNLAVFGLSESLKVAGVEGNEDLLITFLEALGLILLALWLLPRSVLTLKEEPQEGVRHRYMQQVLLALAVLWATLAAIMIAAIGLYAALRVAGVEGNEDLLITFLVALGLILLALWLLPRSFLTLKEERQDGVGQRYIQNVLFALSVIWAILAAIIIVVIGLYAALRVAGVKGDENLLITFLVALGLILLALWLLPRSFLTQ